MTEGGDTIVSSDAAGTDGSRPTVFLSYASEDRPAARRLGAALPAHGLEVWYDESELGGGDAWDQKIRRQIRECDYFMALVSAQTEARHEGYFRREWRLAVERTLDMADDHTFLLPIVIDDTKQAGARVPEKFLAVQWLAVPGGEPNPGLEALCRRLVAGQPPAQKKPARAPNAAPARAHAYPPIPTEEPGQRLRFVLRVIGWAAQSVWIFFKQLPRWIRIVVYVWLAVVFMSKACSSRHHEADTLPPADAQKLKDIAKQYQGTSNPEDLVRLGQQIAHELGHETSDKPAARHPLLAIPFTAPPGDAAAGKLADATFAQVYGRVSAAHPGLVGLSQDPLSTRDLAAAMERGRATHATMIIFGAVDGQGAARALAIKIVNLEDGDVLWSKSYPAAGSDPAKIAVEVASKVPDLDDE